MNHKIRIAISRVDTPEHGTGTFTNAQLEGGEFQFTSKDQVKKYLEDARKTMNEDQIKVLLVSLGCESVDDAMTMVANLSDEEAIAKFGQLAEMMKTAASPADFPLGSKVKKTMGANLEGEVVAPMPKDKYTDGQYREPSPTDKAVYVKWSDSTQGWTSADHLAPIKTADQSSTDVNMPMYNIDNMKNQKIELTNTEAAKVKSLVEQEIDKQLDQIKTQDGATLRDWVHQEGGIQKVLTSTEFKVKQLGYKLLTNVENFVKQLGSKDSTGVEEFIKENGTNIRDWFNKALQVNASAKPSCCTKLIDHVEKFEASAKFTLRAADQVSRIMKALNDPTVKAEVEKLLGPNGVYMLRNFIGFDGNIRNEGSEAVLGEGPFNALVQLFSVLEPYINASTPGLQNCKSVIDQFELFVEVNLDGDASQLDELTSREGADDTAWETFCEQNNINGLLNEDEPGDFNLKDLNEVVSVEWEEVLGIYGDPQEDPAVHAALAAKLDITVPELIETAQQLKNLNEMWDQFQDSWEGPHGDLKGLLEPLDEQWSQVNQEQIMTELANVLETVGTNPDLRDRGYADLPGVH